MKAKYSIVVPCYNEQEALPIFYEAVVPVMEKLNEPFEIVLVNDGSRDNTLGVMKDLAAHDKRVKVVGFSRNFGQQAAIFCGFEHAVGDAVICMDVDLQDPIETVPQMIEQWKNGFEIVHGRRTKRKGESFFKKITSKLYLRFIKKTSGLNIPKDVGEFKLLDRKVIDTINAMPEHNRYLRGLIAWVGYKQTFVEFVRNERSAGQTKYSLKKLFKLAGNGIISYTTWPLTFAMRTGLLLGFLSVAAFITFGVLAACSIALPLTAWLFPTVTVCFAMICVLIGFNNIYFKRLYEEAINRPRYIVSETHNIEK
jgi:dolichol-phosphate mannosyltransferase